MRFDAITVGEVRLRDVVAATEDEWDGRCAITAAVLPKGGGIPTVAKLHFTQKRSGRGMHLALACPVCWAPRAVLFADGRGGLGCATCTKHRTRQQTESRTRAFRRLGGAIEDRLIRLALTSAVRTSTATRLAAIELLARRAGVIAMELGTRAEAIAMRSPAVPEPTVDVLA